MEDEEEEVSRITLAPVKWTWSLPAFTLFSTASAVVDAVGQGLSDIAMGIACHMNYEKDRQDFARDAGLEIERITEE